jgi:hypothetical protein
MTTNDSVYEIYDQIRTILNSCNTETFQPNQYKAIEVMLRNCLYNQVQKR